MITRELLLAIFSTVALVNDVKTTLQQVSVTGKVIIGNYTGTETGTDLILVVAHIVKH